MAYMDLDSSTTAHASSGAASITIPGRSAAHAPPSRDLSQASSLDKYAASPASPARKLAARTFLERDNTRPELRSPHLSPEDAEATTFSNLASSFAGDAAHDAHHRRPEREELAAEGERDEVGFAEAVRREREQRGDYSPIEGGTPGTPPLPHSPLCSSQVPIEDLESLGRDRSDSGPRSAADVARKVDALDNNNSAGDYLSSSPLRWVPKSSKVQTPPLCSSVKGLEPMSVANDKDALLAQSAPARPSPLAS